MSGQRLQMRIFTSYISGRGRIGKWGPVACMTASNSKEAPPGSIQINEETLSTLASHKRQSIDFDVTMTPFIPEIVYTLRRDTLALHVYDNRIELRETVDGLYKWSTNCKITGYSSLFPDLPGFLYLRSGESIVRIDLIETFEKKEIFTLVKSEANACIAAKNGLLGVLSKDMESFKLYDFDPETGMVAGTKKYKMQSVFRLVKESDENTPYNPSAMMTFAAEGILGLRRPSRTKFILVYFHLLADRTASLKGRIDFEIDLEVDKKPSPSLSRIAVLFSKRTLPLAMILHPSNKLQYSVYACKNFKWVNIISFKSSEGLFTRLKNASNDIKSMRIDYDHKSEKIWMLMCRVKTEGSEEGEKDIIVARLRYTV